jgi:hypothetical protein
MSGSSSRYAQNRKQKIPEQRGRKKYSRNSKRSRRSATSPSTGKTTTMSSRPCSRCEPKWQRKKRTKMKEKRIRIFKG